MRVERTTLDVELVEIGIVEATRVVPILAPFRGKLITLRNSGDMVRVGEEVLMMESEGDVTELEDRLNDLQTQRAALESSIESLKIAMRTGTLDLDFAESQLAFERAKLEDVNNHLAETAVLLDHNVVPAEDFRAALSSVDSSRFSTIGRDLELRTQAVDSESGRASNLGAIERAALQGNIARRKLDEARKRIENASITAPVNGMFLRKQSFNRAMMRNTEPRPGDSVREGQTVGEIPDLDSLILKTQIPEGSLGSVHEGDPVRVRFDAYDGLELAGRVLSIGKVAIEREASAAGALVQAQGYSGQKVFEVVVSFDDPDPRVKPGITAQAAIRLGRFENVFAVPVEAVRWHDGGATVGVVGSGGKIVHRPVTLGQRSGERVVVASGIAEGDHVVSRWDAGAANGRRLPGG